MRLRIPIGLNADSDEGLNRPLVVTSTDSRTTIAAQQRHRQAGRDCFQLRTFLTNGLLPTDSYQRTGLNDRSPLYLAMLKTFAAVGF